MSSSLYFCGQRLADQQLARLPAKRLVALVEVGLLIGPQLAQLVADQPGDLHAADRVEQVVRIAAGVDVAHRAVDRRPWERPAVEWPVEASR